MFGGSLLHARGAANARSPSDERVAGTATADESADLRPALLLATAVGMMRSVRYDGASPYRQR